ncbi:hydroxyacid dehydrogenase [Arthrobacter tecti]
MGHTDNAATPAPHNISDSPRPRTLLSIPEHEADAFFTAESWAELNELCDVVEARPDALQDLGRFRDVAQGTSIFITAWGFPRLDSERLEQAPDLRFVMHAASSIQTLVIEEFWAAGIPIAQAGDAMAPSVAELSLTFTLALLRRTPRFDHALRSGADWSDARTAASRPREISGARIGVIGASRTGRRYIDMCRALGAEIAVYDPYIQEADELRAYAADLPEVLSSCDVIAIHAPETPETRGLLGAAELAAIKDGGLLVNTARPALVDEDALYREVSSGRLDAALDVFGNEPLPAGDRWRNLPNVLVTPHLGGATVDSRHRAGRIVVSEIRRFLQGEPLQHALTPDRLKVMG